MAYRYDEDLEFLGQLSSNDLNDLVYCLTHDKNGKPRLTEELTDSTAYKRYSPDHIQYWEEIAAEIQCFGANTFATLVRGGKGVLYKEVLTDVCDKLKVNYNKKAAIDVIEDNLLMKILTDAVGKMSPDELQELAKSVGMENIQKPTKEAMLAAFQTIFRAGGFKSYQLTLIVVNATLKALIGRGLTLTANATMMRAVSVLTGPVGWAVTGIWTALDVAGPAYRVTIPAVIQIAALRQKHIYGDRSEKVSFGETD